MQEQRSPYGSLSEDEARVILRGGTEMPFSGKYDNFNSLGLYACRNCGAPLYRSDDKFNSHCGWPAFDDEIPGAVRRVPDVDGKRMEIRCSNCDAHLGHVFSGERITEKNLRHCVNSLSLHFEGQDTGRLRRAVFAGGCFWGVEALLSGQPGVIRATSGYTGGTDDNPDYHKVCSHATGHYEAVEIIYDPSLTDFETLGKYFLEIHDPTQGDGQGPDIGPQYGSAIFYLDTDQKDTAEHLLEVLRSKGYDTVTQLLPFERFFNAEEYHQEYYKRNGKKPYCHIHTPRF